ncbi:MAG TPA: DnaJ domain-containing protein [Candidatus Angelobacter sp.]|jgi:curved DNA-binding protein CbpA|nr:DnaJ domain-containing protein [Candidatus Angelobacter sp.]
MEQIKWRNLNSAVPRFTAQSLHWADIPPVPFYYDVLQVSSAASPEVIKAAYRALMEKHHPDKSPESRRHIAEEIARLLNEAYAVLGDSQKRREYDRSHGISNGLYRSS